MLKNDGTCLLLSEIQETCKDRSNVMVMLDMDFSYPTLFTDNCVNLKRTIFSTSKVGHAFFSLLQFVPENTLTVSKNKKTWGQYYSCYCKITS